MTQTLVKLEIKRKQLHDYIVMKLEERDYHGVADAAMDLRELEVRVELESIFRSSAMLTKEPE